MICMAYLSTGKSPPEAGFIDRILEQSQRNNAARGVTGLLCHYDGNFLQFLEGEPEDVEAIFTRIKTDPRHWGILHLYRRETSERLFADWSMAVAKPGEVSPELRAFCKGLRELELGLSAPHAAMIEPFVESFRAWMR